MGRVPGLIHNLVVPTELPLSVLEKSPCCNTSQGCESLVSHSSPVATNKKSWMAARLRVSLDCFVHGVTLVERSLKVSFAVYLSLSELGF